MTTPTPIQAQEAGEPVALPEFEDAQVKLVYEMLCEPANPPAGEHWEGFIARKIVSLIAAPTPSASSVPTSREQAPLNAKMRMALIKWFGVCPRTAEGVEEVERVRALLTASIGGDKS